MQWPNHHSRTRGEVRTGIKNTKTNIKTHIKKLVTSDLKISRTPAKIGGRFPPKMLVPSLRIGDYKQANLAGKFWANHKAGRIRANHKAGRIRWSGLVGTPHSILFQF